MNWVRKKSLSIIKSISYENWPCSTLSDLWHTFHLSYNSVENRPINTAFLSEISQADLIKWPPFSKQEFRDAIAKCLSLLAPRSNYISWRHLKSLITNERCLEKFIHIANACINLEYWPLYFKSTNIIIIPKPNKDSYNSPKSFCPIVLLNTIGKLVEKVISTQLQFQISANRFLDSYQFGGIWQCSTIDIGLYFTYIIWVGWLKQCYTSIIAFDIAQFFPSLNHDFLSLCLTKAGLNTNVIGFFNSYHFNCSTMYSWNNFSLLSFNTNIGMGQGSALLPILSTIYLAPIINKKLGNKNPDWYFVFCEW